MARKAKAARATLIVGFVIGRWHRYAKSGFKINPSQESGAANRHAAGVNHRRGCPHAYRPFRPARRRQHPGRRFAPVHGPGGGLAVQSRVRPGLALLEGLQAALQRGQYAVSVCSYELGAHLLAIGAVYVLKRTCLTLVLRN